MQVVAAQAARRETTPRMLRLAQKDDGAEHGWGKEDLEEFLPCQGQAAVNTIAHFPVKGITAACRNDTAEHIRRVPGQRCLQQVRRCAEECRSLHAGFVRGTLSLLCATQVAPWSWGQPPKQKRPLGRLAQ